VEYVHTIVIDSFAISVLTALLMKLAIDAVKGLEHRVASYFRSKQGLVWRALGLISVFSFLFLSKFVILELVNIVFGTTSSSDTSSRSLPSSSRCWSVAPCCGSSSGNLDATLRREVELGCANVQQCSLTTGLLQ
jgi:hypothetical protein